MLRTPIITRLAAALALTLAGCGSEEPAPEPGPAPIPRTATPPQPAAQSDLVDARGLVLSAGAPCAAYDVAVRLKALAAEAGSPVAHVVTPTALEALYYVGFGEAEAAVVPAALLMRPEHRVARDAVEVLAVVKGDPVVVLVPGPSPAREVMDLEGKRVALGRAGSAAAAAGVAVLEAAGLDETSVEARYLDAVDALSALKAGEVDAAILLGAAPTQVPGARALTLGEGAELGDAFVREGASIEARDVIVARRGPTGAEAFAPLVAAGRLALADAKRPTPVAGPSLALRPEGSPLRLAGGPQSGTYAAVAAGLSRAGRAADLAVSPMPTAGSLENLLALATGHAELAIVQEDLLLEALRAPSIAPLVARVRLVAPLHREQVHLVRASNATVPDLAALRGKRVGCGEPGSGTLFTTRRILRAAGIGRADASAALLSVADALDAFGNGKLDAFFAVGGAPLPLLDRVRPALVPLGPVEGYAAAELSSAQYGWLQAPVPTLSTRALLLCRLDLGDEAVRGLVTQLFANRANLAKVHPALAGLAPSDLEAPLEGVRLHEGAKAAALGGLELDTAPAW